MLQSVKFFIFFIRTELICLNLNKTKFIMISIKKVNPDKFDLKKNKYIIQKVNSFKFLGRDIDRSVNF